MSETPLGAELTAASEVMVGLKTLMGLLSIGSALPAPAAQPALPGDRPYIAPTTSAGSSRANAASKKVAEPQARGSEANPYDTSKQARRDAMRKNGIPTSQALVPDKVAKSGDKIFVTRDGNSTVQDAKNDRSHVGQPHWEAGPTKKDPSQPDGLNRSGNNGKPQMAKPKSKAYYNE